MKFLGTDPKNLRVFSDFRLWSSFAAVAALKLRGGLRAQRLSGWCGAAQEIYFTSVGLHHRILQNPVVTG